MSRARFWETRKDSCYGQFLYEQVVPKEHYLVKLKELVPWELFTNRLVRYYKALFPQETASAKQLHPVTTCLSLIDLRRLLA